VFSEALDINDGNPYSFSFREGIEIWGSIGYIITALFSF